MKRTLAGGNNEPESRGILGALKRAFKYAMPIACLCLGSMAFTGNAWTAQLVVQDDASGKPISPDLFGIFFEDLNYAADGGLYAELVQNRSFDFQITEHISRNAFTGWELVQRGGGEGSVDIEEASPIHPNNPTYAVVNVAKPGAGVGLLNQGFDGIPVKAGEQYDFSVFANQPYMGSRWTQDHGIEGRPMPLTVRLEDKNGASLAEAKLTVTGRKWTRLSVTLTPSRTEDTARLVVLATAQGGVALDMISLFPRKTFHSRPNGLRADLAQVIADIKPKFVRFPGGCLVHGNGLGNMYRWKNTIGPVEQRRAQANLWGYHQSAGLGYFEFFQFCEDIGAKPLPVVPAGVCCQNASHTNGEGQAGLPLDEMPAYVQEVLDLIEYANGPATSKWGAQRAAAGHPEPFHLEYLGVGNEDAQTPEFRERFKMIHDAIKARHPEITVIGTVGPFPDGKDFEAGWKFANELGVATVDEHYYKPPQWFLSNLHRYDAYDRNKSKVYVGEYAAHDDQRRSTLRSALAEAAFMTSLERNGDVVQMASYAPLLGKLGRTQWTPDLIYYTNTRVVPTINYQVQKLFGNNAGDAYLSASVKETLAARDLAFSAVREGKSGDVILKLVNTSREAKPLRVVLMDAMRHGAEASVSCLTGDPDAVNDDANQHPITPKESKIAIGSNFDYMAPAWSLTVIRLPKP